VRGGVVVNDGRSCMALAELGLGLAYVFEPLVTEQLRTGRLRRVLEPYAASSPGLYSYYPSRSQHSVPLRLFVETLTSSLWPQGAPSGNVSSDSDERAGATPDS
jgi:DNA-binding transcriptional LysR family regulator